MSSHFKSLSASFQISRGIFLGLHLRHKRTLGSLFIRVVLQVLWRQRRHLVFLGHSHSVLELEEEVVLWDLVEDASVE